MARENGEQDLRPPSAGALLRHAGQATGATPMSCAAPLLEIQPDRADTILGPGFSRPKWSLEGSLEA